MEAREHIRRFHELFFTLSPDRAAIESNINRALFLVAKSAFAYYQDMQAKGYYNRVVSGNISQRDVYKRQVHDNLAVENLLLDTFVEIVRHSPDEHSLRERRDLRECSLSACN